MKQHTNEIQTVKLIELGFGNPKSSVECELPKGDWRIGAVGIRKAYSIGELIEMLPKTIEVNIWWGREKGKAGTWGLRIDTNTATMVERGGGDTYFGRIRVGRGC